MKKVALNTLDRVLYILYNINAKKAMGFANYAMNFQKIYLKIWNHQKSEANNDQTLCIFG